VHGVRGWHLPRHKNTLFRRKPPPPLLLVSPSGMSIFRGAATAAAVVASLFNVRIGRYTYTAYTGYTRSALRCGFLKIRAGPVFRRGATRVTRLPVFADLLGCSHEVFSGWEGGLRSTDGPISSPGCLPIDCGLVAEKSWRQQLQSGR